MDWDHVERMWKQVKGKVQQKWGKLTDDDLKLIDGRRDRLESKIQQRYGFAPDHVRKEVDGWVRWQVPGSPQRRGRTARSNLALADGPVSKKASAEADAPHLLLSKISAVPALCSLTL